MKPAQAINAMLVTAVLLTPTVSSAWCSEVRAALAQGASVGDLMAATGLSPSDFFACADSGVQVVQPRRHTAFGPTPQQAFGPAPHGAFGPAPHGAFGRVPRGAAGPAPLNAFGPSPKAAFGPPAGTRLAR